METQTTILIVDDEPAGREALEGVLFSQGYNLIFAENGKDAFQKALEHMPDLILLDIMMPNMDGFEVCQKMRADSILAEIPILLVTALDDRLSRIKGIEAGADDFISKPFDRIELRARVRTVVRLNRYRRLLLERARFVWVAEQAKEGYVILNSKDQINYANPAARLFLNLPLDEKVSVTFSQWAQKQYHCEPEEAWEQWMQSQSLEAAFYLIRPETDFSQPVWLQVEALTLPDGNGENRLLRISEVTEKLALYQEVLNFHKTITHKLRTPLSSMVMASDLLNRQVAGKAPEDVQELTGMVLSGAKRIKEEVEEILGYVNMSRVATTGSHFNLSDFEAVAIQICKDLSIDKFTLFFEKDLPRDLNLQLSYRAIEVILWELLENSKKFHPDANPSVEIKVLSNGPDAVQVSIRDNGVTLSPVQLRQAWMPYYQAEKEFTGEIDGMGLGLSTVAKLVWEVGGKCRLVNRTDAPGIVVDLILPKHADSIQVETDITENAIRS